MKYLYNRTSTMDKTFFQCCEKKNFDQIESYGPIVNVFKTESFVDIDTLQDIPKRLLRALVSGYLQPDLEDTVRAYQTAGGIFSDNIKGALNPDDIIDSAGLWDDRPFVAWFIGEYRLHGVITYDGGVVFNSEAKISK